MKAPVIQSDESAAGVAADPASRASELTPETGPVGARTTRRGLAVDLAGTLLSVVVAIFCIRETVDGMRPAPFGLAFCGGVAG